MEWMGWNVLLEGRKLWTFLPPLSELDTPLETYRLTPNAFGSHNMSAGWQSNVDLYRSGPPSFDERNRVSWPAAGEGLAEVLQHAVSGVQKEGELVLIPPRYWHQVSAFGRGRVDCATLVTEALALPILYPHGMKDPMTRYPIVTC